MQNDTLLTGFVILAVLYCVRQYLKAADEPFCPYGYCPTDNEQYQKYIKHFKHKYPCKDDLMYQGYDNPYIYPFNYFINQNHPIGRFKYPGWVRQMSLDNTNYKGFPGFGY